MYTRKYVRLCAIFEKVSRDSADERVIEVEGDCIRFHPFNVTSPVATQAHVFDVLSQFSKKHERVTRLTIDVGDASIAKIGNIMTGVMVETVVNGMDIPLLAYQPYGC